jgi:multiple antibiotic resistance protein
MTENEYLLLCITSFITLINPIGILPTFMALTDGLTSKEKRTAALQASFTLLAGILLFAYLGDHIFKLFGITVDALRVVGGLLLLDMGRDLLHGKPPKMKSAADTKDTHIGIVPLGFPVLLGAGAITLAMVRKSQAVNDTMLLYFILSAIIVTVANLIIFSFSDRISAKIGKNGQSVMNRFMGLITMILAIEFIFNGLRPFLIGILKAVSHS